MGEKGKEGERSGVEGSGEGEGRGGEEKEGPIPELKRQRQSISKTHLVSQPKLTGQSQAQ